MTSNRSRLLTRLALQQRRLGRDPRPQARPDLRIVPAFPLWIERGLLLLAGLWFVNLVNFMDGLDWMDRLQRLCRSRPQSSYWDRLANFRCRQPSSPQRSAAR